MLSRAFSRFFHKAFPRSFGCIPVSKATRKTCAGVPLGGGGPYVQNARASGKIFLKQASPPSEKKIYKAFPRAFGCKPGCKLTVCRRAVRGPIPRGGSGGGTPPGESPAGENFFYRGHFWAIFASFFQTSSKNISPKFFAENIAKVPKGSRRCASVASASEARAKRERSASASEKSRKIAKIRKRSQKSQSCERHTTACDSLAVATLALARASRKIQVRRD